MSTAKSAQPQTNRRLELSQVLADLVADSLVPKEVADELAKNRRFARTEVHPLVVIADQKWKDPRQPRKVLHLEALTQWLAEKVGLPYYHIDPFKIDFAAVTKTMSSAYAERFHILPVAITTREVTIATSEPFVRDWEEQIKQVLRLEIKRVLANPVDIQSYLVEFYNLAQSVKGASAKDKGSVSDIANFEQLVQLGRSGKLDANDQHIVHICDWLFNYAFEERASDIHLEPRRDVSNVRFRIDGVLHQVYQIPTPVMGAMTSRIKVLGRMDVVEKRRPQDGRLKTVTPDNEEVELRLSTMPTAFGEKLVMRIFNPENLVKDYKELGFPEEDERKWIQMSNQPHGIILVTGPTGSGKTTTLYSTLKQLATARGKRLHRGRPHRNGRARLQPDAGAAFDRRGLRERHPHADAAGPGHHHGRRDSRPRNRRDGDTVSVDGPPRAFHACTPMTRPSAITRMLDLGVPPYLLQSTILGVMAQRLLRTLCTHCKEQQEIEDSAWEHLVAPWKATKPKGTTYGIKGCLECRMTGYMGRIGIYETMMMTNELRRVITAETDLVALQEKAYKEGMKPLRISGALKVAAGLTTIDEVLQTAPPPTGDRRQQPR